MRDGSSSAWPQLDFIIFPKTGRNDIECSLIVMVNLNIRISGGPGKFAGWDRLAQGHLKSLKREGFKVELVRDSDLFEISRLIAKGEIAKEAAPEIIKWLSENPEKSVKDALDALNLRPVDMGEVERKIDELVERYGAMVKENPRKASSIIMGELMKVYRGRVDGGKLYQMVREKIHGQRG